MFWNFSGIETFFRIKWWGGREYHNFPSEVCCRIVSKSFVWEPFSNSIAPGIENYLDRRGVSRRSIEIVLPHSTETCSRRFLLCFGKLLVSKILIDNRGKEGGREGGREGGMEGRKEGGMEGRREGGKEGGRDGGKEGGGREGGRDGGKEGGRDGGKEGGRDGGKEGGREGGREGRREGGMEGRREGGREGGREYHDCPSKLCGLKKPKAFVGDPFNVSLNGGVENTCA